LISCWRRGVDLPDHSARPDIDDAAGAGRALAAVTPFGPSSFLLGQPAHGPAFGSQAPGDVAMELLTGVGIGHGGDPSALLFWKMVEFKCFP
jgi:hypothetical protein